MNIEDFNKALKEVGLSKKAFSEIIGTSSQNVRNWSNKDNVPYWVDSWLSNYKELTLLRNFKQVIKESGLCNEVMK